MSLRLVSVLALVALLAGCDSGGSDRSSGSFEATLRGDIEADLSGPARFAFFGDPTQPRSDSDDVSIDLRSSVLTSIGIGFGGRPALGTYALGSGGERAPSVNYLEFGTGGALSSTSGTVTITASTAERIVGTFSADLEPSFAEEGETPQRVQATGTFDAIYVELPGFTPPAAGVVPATR